MDLLHPRRRVSRTWVRCLPRRRKSRPPRLAFVPALLPGPDAATSLEDYRNRWLEPATGAWTTRDPLGDVDALNLYASFGGNSLLQVDRFGLASCSDLTPGNLTTYFPRVRLKTPFHIWDWDGAAPVGDLLAQADQCCDRMGAFPPPRCVRACSEWRSSLIPKASRLAADHRDRILVDMLRNVCRYRFGNGPDGLDRLAAWAASAGRGNLGYMLTSAGARSRRDYLKGRGWRFHRMRAVALAREVLDACPCPPPVQPWPGDWPGSGSDLEGRQ